MLALGLGAACGAEQFTVAVDAGSDAGIEDAAGRDALVDAVSIADGEHDAAAPDAAVVPSCESRADPLSPCSLSAAACMRAELSSVPAANSHVFSITADATHVYWVTQVAYNSPALGAVYRVPKTGGATEMIASGQAAPLGVAVDSTWVYWITQGLAGTTMRTVLRVPKATPCGTTTCPTPEPIYAGAMRDDVNVSMLGEQDLFLKSTGTNFRRYFDPLLPGWRSGTPFPSGTYTSVAASPHGIFLGAGATNQVDRISQDGSSSQKLFDVSIGDAGLFPGASWLASDCTSVFALRGSILDLRRHSIAKPTTTTNLAPGPIYGVYAMTADATFVYLGIANGGGIRRTVKKGGGPLDPLVASGNVWAITTDDTAVYWGDHDTGRIARITK